ncbi:hypothetical protein QVD17_37021 [Tagetes erecta]|uniref:Uncharacterized protein n=1 Tax=Tagetes erecta TaxID=13708 RepID=A0AAD8JTH9_TARER|nr:hypothetical protein QVD17_37021 [Tagetes erecta]
MDQKKNDLHYITPFVVHFYLYYKLFHYTNIKQTQYSLAQQNPKIQNFSLFLKSIKKENQIVHQHHPPSDSTALFPVETKVQSLPIL